MTSHHGLRVRSYGTNDETSGIILACSCGWASRIEPPDWETNPRRYEIGGSDAQISLDDLNALAEKHLQEEA